MVNILKNRHSIQALGALAFNGNLKGFLEGKIYSGSFKAVCVPVLNCYSCPGALGSCPIGSMQAVLGSKAKSFSFYVLGLLLLFGITLGRFFCGFLCPFGFFQDLLYKLPIRKFKIPEKLHNMLKYCKYMFLIVFVIILPVIMKGNAGIADPYFCKYICPSGTLFAGLPLLSTNKVLHSAVGSLFFWKLGTAIIVVVLSILTYRPFCKYVCPLGAFYALFNPHSFLSIKVNNKCIECRKCVNICKMGIEPYRDTNSPECIRCGDCVNICPTDALSMDFKREEKKISSPNIVEKL